MTPAINWVKIKKIEITKRSSASCQCPCTFSDLVFSCVAEHTDEDLIEVVELIQKDAWNSAIQEVTRSFEDKETLEMLLKLMK